jgi:hypothetical protein
MMGDPEDTYEDPVQSFGMPPEPPSPMVPGMHPGMHSGMHPGMHPGMDPGMEFDGIMDDIYGKSANVGNYR